MRRGPTAQIEMTGHDLDYYFESRVFIVHMTIRLAILAYDLLQLVLWNQHSIVYGIAYAIGTGLITVTTTTTTTTVIIIIITRMVQLPATAAIEYVAACWVSGAGWIFVRGAFLRRVLCPFPPKFNAYTHRLGFLCLAS